MKDFLEITDLSTDLIVTLLDRADQLYEHWHNHTMPQSLRNRTVALWFYGNGFRNRVAFEVGARQMGAGVAHLPGELGVHEPIQDVGLYLANWFDLLVIRCRNHADLQTLASNCNKPVINARTAYNHPCEILGDLQFIRRTRGTLDGLNVVFVGETSNLCRSWFEAAVRLPVSVTQVAPAGYLLPPGDLANLNAHAKGAVNVSSDLIGTLGPHVDLVYTDCWPQNLAHEEAKATFLPFQITKAHLQRISAKGFFLPCPPISRGQEISEDSLESPYYLNVRAKEFLLHAQNALMEYMLTENGA